MWEGVVGPALAPRSLSSARPRPSLPPRPQSRMHPQSGAVELQFSWEQCPLKGDRVLGWEEGKVFPFTENEVRRYLEYGLDWQTGVSRW